MELRHLRYFVAVAEELNFTRAAERVHIAQPPLSQQIRKFEEEVGVTLFERTGRRVRLTPAGEAVLREARVALVQSSRIPVIARRAAEGMEGVLRVGFSSAAAHTVLPGVVRALRARAPKIKLQLHELSTEHQIESLLAAAIDIGFVRLPLENPPAALVIQAVFREPLVLAVPKGHLLARSRVASKKHLSGAPFIWFPRHVAPGLYDQIDRLCARIGFRPDVVQEAMEIQTIASLVAAGIGVAIVPESTRKLGQRHVVYRALPQAEVTELGIAYERDHPSAALKHFVSVATAV